MYEPAARPDEFGSAKPIVDVLLPFNTKPLAVNGSTKIGGQAAPAGELPAVEVQALGPGVPPCKLVASVANMLALAIFPPLPDNAADAEPSQASSSRVCSPTPLKFHAVVTEIRFEPTLELIA